MRLGLWSWIYLLPKGEYCSVVNQLLGYNFWIDGNELWCFEVLVE
jgi:hypothetical protein